MHNRDCSGAKEKRSTLAGNLTSYEKTAGKIE
jgi:hypothetical protein